MAMSGTRKTVLIIGGILAVLLLVVLIGVAVIVSAFRKGEPSIRDNSVLALRVAGSLPDYTPDTQRTILSRDSLAVPSSLSLVW